MNQPQQNKGIEEYAYIEVQGHKRVAGIIKTEIVGMGITMFKVDVPATSTHPPFTMYFAPRSIFSITVVDHTQMVNLAEEIATGTLVISHPYLPSEYDDVTL